MGNPAHNPVAKLTRRRVLAGATVGLVLPGVAAAQTAPFPARPIRILVGFAAGGGGVWGLGVRAAQAARASIPRRAARCPRRLNRGGASNTPRFLHPFG